MEVLQEEFELRTQINFAFDGNFESVENEGFSSNEITFFFSGIYDQTENEVEGSQRFECQLYYGAIVQCPADFTDPSNDFFTGFKNYTGLTPEEHNFTVTAIMNVDDDGEPVEIKGTPHTWFWTVVNVETTIDSQIDGNGNSVSNGTGTTSDKITFNFSGETSANSQTKYRKIWV